MLATIAIEAGLAVYTLVRYKLNPTTRLIFLTLVCLATFQVAEYFVCAGSDGRVEAWSRLGFATITILPPLGFHLLHVLAKKPRRRSVAAVYGLMALFVSVFLLLPNAFVNYQCTGNYVIFHLRSNLGGVYWLYYMGIILTGMALGLKWAEELRKQGKKAVQTLRNIQVLIISWLVFLVPAAIVNIAKPETRDGLPSIMCGFAVLFALILALYILPRTAKTKPRRKA